MWSGAGLSQWKLCLYPSCLVTRNSAMMTGPAINPRRQSDPFHHLEFKSGEANSQQCAHEPERNVLSVVLFCLSLLSLPSTSQISTLPSTDDGRGGTPERWVFRLPETFFFWVIGSIWTVQISRITAHVTLSLRAERNACFLQEK